MTHDPTACLACQIRADLLTHRDNAHPDWSTTRGAYNYAAIIAAQACPDYRTDRDYPPEEATT